MIVNTLIVVSEPEDWPFSVDGVRVVTANEYLTDASFAEQARLQIYNLCRSYRYQTAGYYVSLLAEARGHRPCASIATIQDLKSQAMIRVASAELGDVIEQSLSPIQSESFDLSVYFGRNLAKRHDSLAGAIFRMFRAPFLRAQFSRNSKSNQWSMQGLSVLSTADIPKDHAAFVTEVAKDYFSGRRVAPRRRTESRYDLAILRDPSDNEPASDERAIKRFVKAGTAVGFAVDVINKDDYSRIAHFDCLFIRDTTSVNHYTYRFARKAQAEGLVVMDSPESILKCMNKVYLAEVAQRNRIPIPKTMIVHKRNIDQAAETLGLPCVLKQPDSAFSAGVIKVDTDAELRSELKRLLDKSALVVGQEFRPTEYDWRIGVLDGQPLYACRYYMARRHWQIIKRDKQSGEKDEGTWDTIPVEQAPSEVLKIAVKAASLYGDALYGVDLKQDQRGVCVIEVNENPSLDAGIEDGVLKDELYLRIMRYLMSRVEQRKRGVL